MGHIECFFLLNPIKNNQKMALFSHLGSPFSKMVGSRGDLWNEAIPYIGNYDIIFLTGITTMKTQKWPWTLSIGEFLAFTNYESQSFLILGECSTWFLVNEFFIKILVEHNNRNEIIPQPSCSFGQKIHNPPKLKVLLSLW